jgi:hypothetical protein
VAESLGAAVIVGCCLLPQVTAGLLRYAVVVLGVLVVSDAWLIYFAGKEHAEQVAALRRRLGRAS